MWKGPAGRSTIETVDRSSRSHVLGAPNSMAHDVFISYSQKDKPTADAACAGWRRPAFAVGSRRETFRLA